VLRTIDLVRTTKIERVVEESSNIRSLIFKDEECLKALPGQFVMVWLPGVGEFPMSVSLTYEEKSSIVIKPMGEGSRALFDCTAGKILGIRGPYGTGFVIPESSRRILLVGGGTGIAPILRLAETRFGKRGKSVSVVIGARSKPELPFLPLLKKFLGASNVYPTTDDGSVGFKGFAHEQVASIVQKGDIDLIFCCGPEAMMFQVFNIASQNKIPAQFSLERIMKCGIAICGSCCIQDVVLCQEGPVLSGEKLSRLSKEFGRLERDRTGTLVNKS
jgi:dihydroorotate dehydrogenase electron transfer subunit